MRPLTDTLPKPLAPVGDRAFLDFLLAQMHDFGIEEVLVLTGYLGSLVEQHCERHAPAGMRIRCNHGPESWDTAERLRAVLPLLEETFLLMYSDNFAPIAISQIWDAHDASSFPCTVLAASKVPGNVRLEPGGAVIELLSGTRSDKHPFVELGYGFMTLASLQSKLVRHLSFSAVLAELAAEGALRAHVLPSRYLSISDSARHREAVEYLTSLDPKESDQVLRGRKETL